MMAKPSAALTNATLVIERKLAKAQDQVPHGYIRAALASNGEAR
ncbi:hypothetical protein [Methylobacterium iners]|uniref:Uncharacterized protein n=1 Tax=Methylobacterium iners TaxID=418707 RepID=A0ABQ4RZI0_9HYPH|nr:hypothetical protein [Methylobacterium iners]GJD96260.1 hypothetical protein OCOJLMKI_3480 [Methylobacterium iners]